MQANESNTKAFPSRSAMLSATSSMRAGPRQGPHTCKIGKSFGESYAGERTRYDYTSPRCGGRSAPPAGSCVTLSPLGKDQKTRGDEQRLLDGPKRGSHLHLVVCPVDFQPSAPSFTSQRRGNCTRHFLTSLHTAHLLVCEGANTGRTEQGDDCSPLRGRPQGRRRSAECLGTCPAEVHNRACCGPSAKSGKPSLSLQMAQCYNMSSPIGGGSPGSSIGQPLIHTCARRNSCSWGSGGMPLCEQQRSSLAHA